MKIVLTGFMGTGKTKVGKILARRLGLAFVDTDGLIEERAGLSINKIFEQYGESHFRVLEKKVIKEVSEKDGVVIAIGGGAFIAPENRANLKKKGVTVALLAEVKEIARRTANDTSRPLLKEGGRQARIKTLLKKRLPYYRKADFCLDTTGKSPGKVVQEIINFVKK
ncbi:MAG: shikimate kinase [Candidatus Omnitrophota bacterium]